MREIGSDFERPRLVPVAGRSGMPVGDASLFLASGRDALHWTAAALGVRSGVEVLLPAYLCADVVSPFVAAGAAVRFYRVHDSLRIDADDFFDHLSRKPRLVLVVDYFGFPTEPSLTIEAARHDAVTVQDASHSWLSALPPLDTGVRVASLRKLLPVPDGAFVTWSRAGGPPLAPVALRQSLAHRAEVAGRWLAAAVKALWVRHPRIVPRATFRGLFALAEGLVARHPRPAPMSRLSRAMLGLIDVAEVIATRRRNYRHLREGLAGRDDISPLYPDMPDGVTPLGFPVVCADRDALRRHLIAHRVYPPVHWALPPAVDRRRFAEAWRLSERILTIPIDQRYDETDMERVLAVVRGFSTKASAWAIG